MPIAKSFQLYISDSQGNPVKRIGAVPFCAVKNVLDMTLSYRANTEDWWETAHYIFGSLVDDPGYIGGAISDFMYQEGWYEEYDQLRQLAPFSVMREVCDYAGSYALLAGNESGYYAISHSPINSQGMVLTWDLYDNRRRLIASEVDGFGFPLYNSVGISTICYTVENDGKISLTEGNLYGIRVVTDVTPHWLCSCQLHTYSNSFLQWYNGVARGSDSGDPYDDTGDSDTGGGDDTTGEDDDNYTDDSDDNEVPDLPTVSATDSGFITLYNPSITQLKNLASYMWSGLFDLNSFRKIMANPMDAILGLSIVPVDVPNGGTKAVTVGNISTGVSMTTAASQYVEVNCGKIDITEYWRGYMDYSPYTKLEIFLPYIGTKELDIDFHQKTALGVKYHVDILSGACVAFVTANGRVICEFSGQCAVSIPISGNDWTRMIGTLGQLVASGVAMGVTGGMTAPLSAVSATGLAQAASSLGDTAKNVMCSKPTYAKSGNLGSANGLMGSQKPFIIISRPKQCHPRSQNIYTGYPSYITYRLGAISGFTIVEELHLDNIPCTDEEHDEILRLLMGGVRL